MIDVIAVLVPADPEPPAADADAFDSSPAPAWTVPRLHAVRVRREPAAAAAAAAASAPALCQFAPAAREAARQRVAAELPRLRQQAVARLAAALGGDAVAGEALLLHAVSRVASRAMGVPVGR